MLERFFPYRYQSTQEVFETRKQGKKNPLCAFRLMKNRYHNGKSVHVIKLAKITKWICKVATKRKRQKEKGKPTNSKLHLNDKKITSNGEAKWNR